VDKKLSFIETYNLINSVRECLETEGEFSDSDREFLLRTLHDAMNKVMALEKHFLISTCPPQQT